MFTFRKGNLEFLYKDELFRQIDGVAMGSPLAPTLANMFISHLEKTWLNASNRNAPVQYYRYVDDIFCVFDADKQDFKEFFRFINNYHSNIKFTYECDPSKLPFLDVNITTRDGRIERCVYRKPTYTNLVLNFNAF